jgi:hypothetical protein
MCQAWVEKSLLSSDNKGKAGPGSPGFGTPAVRGIVAAFGDVPAARRAVGCRLLRVPRSRSTGCSPGRLRICCNVPLVV